MRFTLIRLLLALWLGLAACTPRMPADLATSTSVVPTTAPDPTIALTAEASPTPRVAPTTRPLPTAAGTLDPDATARHLRIFEQLWNTVDSQYVYADFHGVDWSAVYGEFEARVDGGLSDEVFWPAMGEMIARLDDGHSVFLPPAEARQEDAQLNGNLSYVGVGIYATTQIDKRQAVIFHVFPGSPAEEAGLRAHDVIISVDGQPVVTADGVDQIDRLRGPSGSPVSLMVRSPGQAARTVSVTRRRVDGVLHSQGQALRIEQANRRIGYVMIPTLWDAPIADDTRRVLLDMQAGGPLDGLIIDMRINGGGSSNNLLALLGFFTAGRHGEFASRDQTRPLQVAADPALDLQSLPLVILIGPDTQSYAEVFSGVLREAGRARLVGQPTAGNIETIYGYDFEDGSRAWIARETYLPADGNNWEDIGLTPEVSIDADWDEFTDANDPYIAAALDLFSSP